MAGQSVAVIWPALEACLRLLHAVIAYLETNQPEPQQISCSPAPQRVAPVAIYFFQLQLTPHIH